MLKRYPVRFVVVCVALLLLFLLIGAVKAQAETVSNKAVQLVNEDAPAGNFYAPAGQSFQNESEPNNSVAQANAIPGSSATILGTIYPSADLDYFSFTAAAGDRVYAGVMTSFSASGSTDSALDVLASDGTTVLETDNDDGTFGSLSSSIAGTVIPSNGTYYLYLRHNTGSQLRPYHLHFRLQSGSPTAEVEPNDSTATAQSLPSSGWISGSTSSTTDADYYALTLNAGDTVHISLDMDPERDSVEWNGWTGMGAFGGFILVVNDAGTSTPDSESFYMTATNAGTYYVFVGIPTGGTTFGTYHLSVTVKPAAAQSCTTYSSTDTPLAIPDLGSVASTISVPGSPIVADLNLTITATHNLVQDLDVSLISPAGNESGIFTDIGSSTAGTATTVAVTFDDEAAIPPAFTVIQGQTLMPESSYRLSWFDGVDAGGNWQLVVRDDLTANTGTLTGWSLTICEPEPEPTCPAGSSPVAVLSADFEADNGGFTHSGTADEWEWGLPSFVPITSCNGGVGCWKTDLDNTYDASTQDLYSPAIDLSSYTGLAWVTWSQKYQMETATYDHAYVDVQQVGGTSPTRLWEWLDATMTTTVGNPSVTIQESGGWGQHQADISSYLGQNVELRFHLDGDSTLHYGGLAIDDVTVMACVVSGATATPTNTPVTNTPTATPIIPTNTPTNTAVPPTNTPTNTAVPPTNTPTNTAVPPTNTPTATPSAGYCSSPNVAIPDNNPAGVSDPLSVVDTGTLTDLNVSVQATHTWVGDLIFTLQHVGTGTTVTIIDRPGVPTSTFGCSGNNITATLDDEAATLVEDECGAGVPTINGTFIPNNALSAFDGEDLSGSWTMTVSDNAGGDTGTLVQWCLIPTTGTVPTETPTNTPEPPTETPTNTPEPPTETPTNTPEPPTETPTNTPEPPTATATNTAEPPTSTPTATPSAGYCSSPNVAIPDNNPAGVSDPLSVVDTGTLTDLNVSVQATHTWVGDLIFTLQHVGTGTTVTIIDRPGVPASTFGCSGNNITATLDDEAATLVEDECGAGVPTINGTFIPNNALSAFDGEDLSGSWTMTVSDNAGGDTGTLVQWCLIPTTGTVPTETPTNTPEPPTETPTNTPEPPTETPTNTPEPPTATATNTAEPPTSTPTATPSAGYCSSPNVAIPDNNPAGVSDPLSVVDTGTLTDLDVSVQATHTWVGDLIFTLQHVGTGTTVTIIDRPGVPATTFGCSGNNITATLDDEAATLVEDECGAGVPTINGTFIPNNALSAFDGEDLSGSWTMTVSDNAGGDTGTLVQWCLIPTTGTVPTETPTNTPEPGTSTPTATNTPIPPTNTPTSPAPTNTPTAPAPTDTPTATPPAAPNITVDPASLSSTQPPNTTVDQTLDIGNSGGSDLLWTMAEEPTLIGEGNACTALGDVPWLSEAPINGTIAPAGTTPVTVTFDSTGLAAGTYNANLCISSNDPDEPMVAVPVVLIVTGTTPTPTPPATDVDLTSFSGGSGNDGGWLLMAAVLIGLAVLAYVRQRQDGLTRS